jgi:hypothetical protein
MQAEPGPTAAPDATAPRPIVIAGHSHVASFRFWPHTRTGLIPLPLLDGRVCGFQTVEGPYQDSHWDTLVEQAAGKTVILFWLGNQYLGDFFFAPEEPFDLILANRPSLPVQAGARLVPENLVREHQRPALAQLEGVIRRLQAQPGCQVLLGATPPPKEDGEALRALMAQEGYFRERLDALNAGEIAVTPSVVLLKLWSVQQDLMADIARANGVDYLPAPAGAQDAMGFLRPEYWAGDVTHANAAYGILFMDAIAQRLGLKLEPCAS